MSETKNQDSKLTLRKPGRLELKKTVETGQVKQSFSHGRSKTVTVEVKRKRTFERGKGGKMEAVQPSLVEESVPTTEEAEKTFRNLTEGERAARLRALQDAAHDDEVRRVAEADAARKAEEEAARQAEEEAKRKEEEEAARLKAEEEARQKAEEQAKAPPSDTAAPRRKAEEPRRTAQQEEKTREDGKGRGKGGEQKKPLRLRDEPRRRAGKLTITQALESEDEDLDLRRGRSLAALRRQREKERQQGQEQRSRREKVIREVVVPETISVADLANRMAERATDVVRILMKLGVMASVNHVIDADTAELVVAEFGHKLRRVSESDVETGLSGPEDDPTKMEPRAPVVTVMGHVDHGKTSLLDALRATDVVAGEAGGITQHIGAYQVNMSGGQKITFLDTPGHEAFTSMRARGAKVTDIVVLVVAADDGVRPQTVEAINHAKAAEVPIIIAINKCDRPEADANKIRNQLLEHELVVEALGGDILDVEVSATAKTNLDKLEEAILLQAELLELKANPERTAQGAIVEAKLERGRGSVATILVQNGTLEVGDIFVAGSEWGRVRALLNDHGKQIESAGPSVPVEVLGLQGTPEAGDDFLVLEDEGRAREVAEYRQRSLREKEITAVGRGTLEQMFDQIKAGEAQELAAVVKADVQGSLEAIRGALEKLSTDEVRVRVLHGAVGGITESDVTLAHSSGGVVIGFNVRANPQAREMARRDGVDIRYYSIIYDVMDDMKALMSGLLAPEQREKFLGYAEIREVFNISKVGKVAGCMVTEGKVMRGAKVRLLRDDVVIFEGNLKQLKRFKDDVREVQNGYECGMALENYDDIKDGDILECYEVEEVARAL